MRSVLPFLLTLAGLVPAACAAHTPGGQPHDMGAAAHEREAGEHDRIGDQHAAAYDPAADREHLSCAPGRVGRSGANAAVTEDACWSSVRNPTAGHLEEAERHKRQAADHRAASAALRDAEEQACGGIAAGDRDTSPFQHTEDIVDVTTLKPSKYDVRSGPRTGMIGGAIIRFRAVPGLTVARLQEIVNCHLARNAALGHVVPEMPDCPLVPRRVEARVSSAGEGFAVTVRSDDPESARDIVSRAERLRATRPDPASK